MNVAELRARLDGLPGHHQVVIDADDAMTAANLARADELADEVPYLDVTEIGAGGLHEPLVVLTGRCRW